LYCLHPTCFGPSLAHHQGCVGCLLMPPFGSCSAVVCPCGCGQWPCRIWCIYWELSFVICMFIWRHSCKSERCCSINWGKRWPLWWLPLFEMTHNSTCSLAENNVAFDLDSLLTFLFYLLLHLTIWKECNGPTDWTLQSVTIYIQRISSTWLKSSTPILWNKLIRILRLHTVFYEL
jgi:hypothetical protein